MTTSNEPPSYASALLFDPQKAYEDALDDVHTRFVLNLPDDELATPERIFFQLEQAWWFYDDMICDASDKDLPRFKSLKPFALKMFEISPLLQPMRQDFDKLWNKFTLYKRTISTYGTILLNEACTKVILCRLWNSPSWTYPAGKVNQNEAGIDAGARETYEETGFDPNCQIGLTAALQAAGQVSWQAPLREEDALVFQEKGGKRRTCYVCRGVPEDFPFSPVARKEVSQVAWHDLDDIPKKSFAVLPYMGQLRRWISRNTRRKTPGKKREKTPKKPRSRNSTPGRRSRNSSRGKVREGDDTYEGLAKPGEDDGWTEEDMFKANEKILGRKIEYDGNPHYFAEKGFDGKDPHSFHVVGGTFMNSGGVTKLAPAPQQSKLQPLFRREQEADEDGLKPFFSDGGATPWGDIVSEAQTTEPTTEKKTKKKKKKGKTKSPPRAVNEEVDAGQALLSMLQSGGTAKTQGDSEPTSIFATDAEITARSQREKDKCLGASEQHGDKAAQSNLSSSPMAPQEWVDQWVENLPQTPATERFGDFRIDVDAVMLAMNL